MSQPDSFRDVSADLNTNRSADESGLAAASAAELPLHPRARPFFLPPFILYR